MFTLKSKLALVISLLFIGDVQSFGQDATSSAKEQVDKLIAVIKSDAPQKEKADACRELARVGTKDAVAPLAALLTDEKLSHMARYGLETIPDPSADAALRDGLGKCKGMLLAGVIGSLGVRHDVQAVKPLTGLLEDADPEVSQAAARALGKIATPAAVKALQAALPKAAPGNQLSFYEGLFRCAEAFMSKGQSGDARAIYDQMRTPEAPQQVRAGALRGAILSRGKDGLPLIDKALRAEDYVQVAVAARVAIEMKGTEVTKVLTAALPQLPADKQVLVLQTLGKRADAGALPTIVALTKTGPKAVRMAAIRVLPEIGQAGTVPVLVGLLADPDAELAQAAQEGLAGTKGPEADAAVVALLGGQAAERLTGIDLIGRRRMVSCLPALLKAATDSDAKVRPAAIKRVGELGSPSDVDALLGLLKQAGSQADIEATEQALIAVCEKAEKPEACSDKLTAALAQAQPAQKGALLRVLTTVGGASALKATRAGVDDSNADVHGAAIRALAAWKTVDAAPLLLAIAQSSSDATDKMLCLRGYLDWAAHPDVAVGERLAMCQKASGLIQRTEEKKLLLGAVGSIGTIDALALIVPYLDDAATKEEAAAATAGLAEKLLKADNAAAVAPKLVAPLQKAAEVATNADLAKRAKALLQQAQAKAK